MLNEIRKKLELILKEAPVHLQVDLNFFGEENFIHTQILALNASKDPNDLPKVQLCCLIVELVRTTLSLHQQIQEWSRSRDLENVENKIKHSILEGDYLFMRALALVPQLNSKELEEEIHHHIEVACSGYLNHSINQYKVNKYFSWLRFFQRNHYEISLVQLCLQLSSKISHHNPQQTIELKKFSRAFLKLLLLYKKFKAEVKVKTDWNLKLEKVRQQFQKSSITTLTTNCLELLQIGGNHSVGLND